MDLSSGPVNWPPIIDRVSDNPQDLKNSAIFSLWRVLNSRNTSFTGPNEYKTAALKSKMEQIESTYQANRRVADLVAECRASLLRPFQAAHGVETCGCCGT